VTLRDDARRRLCDADGEAIVNVWKTWSWTTAINQVDASAFEDWLVSTPTSGYSGSTHSVLEGHSMDCGRAGTDGEGRPEPDARGPQADRRAPAHTCSRTGALLGSPLFHRVDAASLILERRSRRIHERTIPFDASTRGGASRGTRPGAHEPFDPRARAALDADSGEQGDPARAVGGRDSRSPHLAHICASWFVKL
jgi:hypothetical protein